MHKILVIRPNFPLDALHVSDCISPSSGATFISCTSHLVYVGTCRYLWLLCGYSHTTATRMVPAYTKRDDARCIRQIAYVCKVSANYNSFSTRIHFVYYKAEYKCNLQQK